MPTEELRINVNQRRLLVETVDRSRFVKAGDRLGPFSLPEVDGGNITLGNLLANGLAVLIFFRFAGCPACNIALPYHQVELFPALQELGVPLTAISPQARERLAEIKRRHALGFTVTSDAGNARGKNLGIAYTYDRPSRELALSKGVDMGEVTGTGTWQLPMPTVLVVDQDRTVRFADMSPDWLSRAEATTILDAVRALVGKTVQ
jgi:peroxiredoxin